MRSTAQFLSFLESSYRGFSCPFEPFHEEVIPLIVQEYTRGISRTYIDQLRGNALDDNRVIVDSILPWLEGQEVEEAGWDQCFGSMYHALIHDKIMEEPVNILSALAIHLASCGLPGTWQAIFESTVQFRWANLLLPPTTSISIESNGNTAYIHTAIHGQSRQSFPISKKGKQWYCDSLEDLLVVTGYDTNMTFLPRDVLSLRDFDNVIKMTMYSIDKKSVKVFEDSLDIINKHVPKYIPWLRRAIHDIFLLSPTDMIHSGSIAHYLGLVYFSAHPKPLAMAELLIHEAAHQHMNFLSKIGPVDNGLDQKMYYSPPVKKNRKIDLILAAYHAFANVLIFYRQCRDSGIGDTRECDRQEQILLPWLNILEPPLIDNPSLTNIGNALWQPLKEMLR